jgi:hypothetical protein
VKNTRGSVSIVGILIALVLAALLMYRVSKTYFLTSLNTRSEDARALAGEGLSAKSPAGALDSARQRAAEAAQKTQELENSVNTLE